MIAYKNRFHGHSSLRFVYKNGDTVRRHSLTLRTTKNPHRNNPRIAVVVSKKIIKSAVGRNRIRRRVYEQFRLLLPDIAINSDIVCIITQASVKNDEISDITNTLVSAITEAGLYKKDQ